MGIAVYLALLLTSSLFAAPLVATHLDFNHHHPEGTESHVHDVSAVLGPGILGPGVTVTTVPFVVAFLVPLFTLVLPRGVLGPANRAPAPPCRPPAC